MRFDLWPSTCNGRPTIAVVVTNDGGATAPGVRVEWAVEYETPLAGGDDWVLGDGLETARSVSFITADNETSADVPPGESVTFYLPPVAIDRCVRSWLASLSPDRHAIEVASGGRVERYCGTHFAELLPAIEGG